VTCRGLALDVGSFKSLLESREGEWCHRRASALHALHCMQHRPPSSFSVSVGRSTRECVMLLVGRFTLWLRGCHPRCVHAWCDRSCLGPTLVMQPHREPHPCNAWCWCQHQQSPSQSACMLTSSSTGHARHDVLAWISPPQSVWMEPKHNKLGRKCCARRRRHVRDYCWVNIFQCMATILQQSTPTPLLAQGSSCGHDLEIMLACSTPPPILRASLQHTFTDSSCKLTAHRMGTQTHPLCLPPLARLCVPTHSHV
jgi:hypothetical protein